MVNIKIKTLEVDSGVTIESILYEVSDDELFSNIVATSEPTGNITSVSYDIELDPTKKYYARARALLNPGGYTVWGNIVVFTPSDVVDIVLDNPAPSRISPPSIILEYPVDKFQGTLFNIIVSGYSVLSEAKHESTTYWIENSYGDVIWMRERDTMNLNKVTVTDIILKEDEIYRIKVIMHSTTSDISPVISETVLVRGNEFVEITSNVTGLNVNVDNEIATTYASGLTTTTWELFQILPNNTTVEIDTYITDNSVGSTPEKLTIPANTLNGQSKYILLVNNNLDTTKSVVVISTF